MSEWWKFKVAAIGVSNPFVTLTDSVLFMSDKRKESIDVMRVILRIAQWQLMTWCLFILEDTKLFSVGWTTNETLKMSRLCWKKVYWNRAVWRTVHRIVKTARTFDVELWVLLKHLPLIAISNYEEFYCHIATERVSPMHMRHHYLKHFWLPLYASIRGFLIGKQWAIWNFKVSNLRFPSFYYRKSNVFPIHDNQFHSSWIFTCAKSGWTDCCSNG